MNERYGPRSRVESGSGIRCVGWPRIEGPSALAVVLVTPSVGTARVPAVKQARPHDSREVDSLPTAHHAGHLFAVRDLFSGSPVTIVEEHHATALDHRPGTKTCRTASSRCGMRLNGGRELGSQRRVISAVEKRNDRSVDGLIFVHRVTHLSLKAIALHR